MYVTGVTVPGVTFLVDTPVKISISGLMYVTGVTVPGVTFLVDNTSEDQYIRSYVCLWLLPSLWITPVKGSHGLMDRELDL